MAAILRVAPRGRSRAHAHDDELDRDDRADRERPSRPVPGKVARTAAAEVVGGARQPGDQHAAWRGAAPGKVSQYDVGAAMPPAQALRYAEWVGHMGQRVAAQGPISRRASSPHDPDVSEGSLASAFAFLEQASAGQPLPADLVGQLSAELGADLSAARIHTDERAARSAAALGARAFTLGHDIFFAAGAYDPASLDGLELLAHEAAHVAQHLRGGVATPGRKVSRPDDAHEHQADEAARRFVARRRAQSTDPAELVEEVRRHGQRLAIPGLGELERELGADLGHVQAFTGEAAQRACQLLAAGAFAVRNIVAFADASPQRETLLHELTHIVQMGSAATATPGAFRAGTLRVASREDPAEREARAVVGGRAGPVAVVADPDVVHRTDPDPVDPDAWDPEAAKARFRVFLAGRAKLTDPDHPRYCDETDDSNRYTDSTADSFRSGEYVAAAFAGVTGMSQTAKTGELLHLWQDHAVELGLCKVGSGSWFAWVAPSQLAGATTVASIADRVRAKRSVVDKWVDYLAILASPSLASYALAPEPVEFTRGVHCPFIAADDADTVTPLTDPELTLCRHSMVDAFVACQAFHWGGGGRPHWETFFEAVVSPPGGAVFLGVYSQIQGTIFGEIATEDINAALVGGGGAINRAEHFFADPDFTKNASKTIAADAITVVGTRIQHAAVVDFKSGVGSATTDMLNAAHDYNLIVTKPVPSYKIEGVEQRGDFQHVLYVFATQEIAQDWAPRLRTMIPGDGVLQILPDPEMDGIGTIDMSMNPTFQVQLADETATTHQLEAPPILHPGIEFASVTVTTAAPGSTEVVSGSATLDVDLGGALGASGIVLPMTALGGNQVQLENRLPGLAGQLADLLSGVEVEARVTDDGVAGTLSVAAGTTIGVVTITGGEATIAYSNSGELSVSGQLDLSYSAGLTGEPITGSLTLGWASGGWTFTGQVDFPAGMVDGLSAFSASLSYGAGTWRLGVDQVTYSKTFNAITLTGTASGVDFNLDTGMLSGLLQLEADLGMFGTASASADLTDNRLTNADFSYDSPEFRYPADSESPTFTGTVSGTISYSEAGFSGTLSGTAGLNIPALQSLVGEGGLGLVLAGTIDAEGRYSGSIGTTTPILLGDHLRIPSIACAITADGEVEGDFDLEVVNFRHLESVSIGMHVDRDGVSIREAAAAVSFGTDADRCWGTLSVAYAQDTGLAITGELSVRIKEGMVATGTLTYDSTDNQVDVALTVEEITLLEYGPVSRTLFAFTRQIPLVNAYGVGVYLDLGFDLSFSYEFDLRLQPTISLEGFSLDTFAYEEASAEVELRGALVASLTATPRVGLGLFALAPSLLRGGGGVTIPIVGEARLLPTGTLTVAYTPDGGVSGDAQLALPLTFGIRGNVVPYAELSLLDGLWNPSWTGESLADFEIMPPKELFNFQLDLGGDLSTQEPVLPTAPAAPSASTGPQLAQEAATPTVSAAAAGGRDTEVPTTGPEGASGELPAEPVNLGGMTAGLQALPGYQTLADLMERAGAAWGAIGDFFGRVVNVFRDFLVSLGDGVQEIIDGFVANGLGYLPQLLHRMVGDDAWNIIEPIITALTSSAEALLGLFEATPPTDITEFFPWALQLAANAWGMAFDNIGALVSALQTMFDRLGAAATQLVTSMVAGGMVGVRRHRYYIWYVFGTHHFFVANQYKINLLGISIDYWDQGAVLSPTSAVGIGLFEILERMGVPPSGDYFDEHIGSRSRDRWA